MEYKVSAKKDGKWAQYGRIKEGTYGPQLSFKKTPEFMKLINESNEWINFALYPFEDKSPQQTSDEPIPL